MGWIIAGAIVSALLVGFGLSAIASKIYLSDESKPSKKEAKYVEADNSQIKKELSKDKEMTKMSEEKVMEGYRTDKISDKSRMEDGIKGYPKSKETLEAEEELKKHLK